VTWALGCNRAAAEAAIEGEFPAVFGIESPKRGTPVGAAVAMGVFSTGVLLLYGFLAKSNEDLFWSLFAFSAVIFLLPYLGMLSAFVKARTVDVGRMRPYAVPGGYVVATFCAILCMSTLSLSLVFFMYTPGEGLQWPVIIGAALMIAIGEVLIRMTERKRRVAAR
jgi:amino acid transporter